MVTVDILYFAWLRERIDTPRERVETSAKTVAELIADLANHSARHAAAFADPASVRVALDQQLSDFSAPIAGVAEIAFCPPLTGG